MLHHRSIVKDSIAKHSKAMNEFLANTVSPKLRAVAEERLRAVEMLRSSRERKPTPVTALLATIRKRRKLFLWIWGGLLFAVLLLNAISGPKYTATASLEPDMRIQESAVKGIPGPILDPGAVVDATARRIQSYPTARAVVDKLHMAVPREPSLRNTLSATVSSLLGTRRPSETDVAVRQLLGGLDVKGDRKAYVIALSYTSPDATKAAEIVNAVASEYVHNIELQRLTTRLSLAQRTLFDLEASYGDSHPAIQRARSDLDGMRASLERYRNGANIMTADELTETGMVVPAQAITIPSGLTPIPFLLMSTIMTLMFAAFCIAVAERRAIYKFVRRSKLFAALEAD